MHSPFSPLVHAVLQFVSDLVYALVLCLVYRIASPGWLGLKLHLALLCGAIVWLGGVPMTYLGLVNGGYLPAGISIATTFLALATFFIASPLLPALLPVPSENAR